MKDENVLRENAATEIVIGIIEGELLKMNRKILLSTESRLLEDIGLDSLALMNVLEEVQIKCGISFLPDDYSYSRFESIGSIANLVKERLKSSTTNAPREHESNSI